MTKLILLLFLSLHRGLWGSLAHAGNNTPLFQSGLDKYQNKDFNGAAVDFTEVLKSDLMDSAAMTNAAISLAQQKRWGLALSYLRQAQLISPRQNEIRETLDYIESQVGSRLPSTEDSFLASAEKNFGQYFLVSEILVVHWLLSVILLLVLSRLFRNRRRAHLRGTEIPGWSKGNLGLALSWIALSMVLVLKIGWVAAQRATVIANNSVQVRSGPFSEATELAQIPEGALITVRDHHQDWVQVRFSDQPVGWVERKNIRLVAVDTPPVALK